MRRRLEKGKYSGEIWFENQNNKKCFCILELKEDQIYLTTNLIGKRNIYREDIIYGIFNGLGYLTFIDCQIESQGTGMIEERTYIPKYTFSSYEKFISPKQLMISEIRIENKSILNWLNFKVHYDSTKSQVKSQKKLDFAVPISETVELKLSSEMMFSRRNNEVNIKGKARVIFNFKQSSNIIDCLEFYKSFQKFLLFIYGSSQQFNSFYLKLKNEDTVNFYYKDSLIKKTNRFLVLQFDEFKEVELKDLIYRWFSDERIQYCTDILIENNLSVKTSHYRRFVNSYSAFEAYNYKFKIGGDTVKKQFDFQKDLIQKITGKNIDEVNTLIKDLVRSRVFLTHRNQEANNIHSEMELLYLSYLIDYIVSISILKKLEVDSEIIEKIIKKAKSNYRVNQSVHRILNKDLLKKYNSAEDK